MNVAQIMSKTLVLAVFLALAAIGSDRAEAGKYTKIDRDGYMQLDGVARGAPFRIVVPADWNGELVVLLHGLVPERAPLQLPPVGHEIFDPLSEGMMTRGFAVAYSAYRINGLAIEDGIHDSALLYSIFSSEFGRPSEVYLTGYSMGTHIGQRLVESGPRRYAGFLAVCGALGGASIQNAYFGDARVLFDYFYPGVLPGDILTTDLDYFSEVFPLVFGAVSTNPLPAIELAAVLGLAWNDPFELVVGVASSLVGAGGGTLNEQAVRGGNPYDNSATVYTGSADDDMLNAGVGRFVGDPQALQNMRRLYDPRGRLRGTPVLQLHTTRDAVVPVQWHAPVYQALLAENGEEDRYVVRTADRFGHCTFAPEEVLASFDDLVLWARDGIKPTP